MSEKEGTLRMQPSGRWAVCMPGRKPIEINSGDVFRVEVGGELKPTRIAAMGTGFRTGCARRSALMGRAARRAGGVISRNKHHNF
jgi:hypothetical protein